MAHRLHVEKMANGIIDLEPIAHKVILLISKK